jgi:hypothetical protein
MPQKMKIKIVKKMMKFFKKNGFYSDTTSLAIGQIIMGEDGQIILP